MTHTLQPRRHSRGSSTWRRATTGIALVVGACCVTARADLAGDVHEALVRGEARQALERIDTATAKDAALAREPRLRFLRGVALMDLAREGDALAVFEAMAQDYPELPDPWNNIALLHVRANRLEPARQALETALRNDPSYRTARVNLGLVHLMLAVQSWEQAASVGPPDALLAKRLEQARGLLTALAR